MSETFYSPEEPSPLSASQEYYDDEFRRLLEGPLRGLAKKIEMSFDNEEQSPREPAVVDEKLVMLIDHIGDASWEINENSRVRKARRLGSEVIRKLINNNYVTRLTRRPGT